jgi:phosphate:Na+ symporter
MVVLFLNLAAAVALLVWSIRLIRTGVERGFSPEVRRGLTHLSKHNVTAAAGGGVAAMIMQSSTAVALIASGFAVSGLLSMPSSLALVLGAELGSSIMAWVLILPSPAAVPVLILVGVVLFFKARGAKTKQLGRIVIGVAMVLMSIGMIRTATTPVQDNDILRLVVGYFEQDLLFAYIIGAALAWVMHSSLAAVVTFATFATTGVIGGAAAIAMVIGANLGGALIAFGLLWSAERAARLVITANVIARATVTAIVLGIFMFGMPSFDTDIDAGHACVISHIAINATLWLFLPVAGHMIAIANRIMPADLVDYQDVASALDDETLENPNLALACAQRELVHMFETMQNMLSHVLQLFRVFDPDLARVIDQREKNIDSAHYELKMFLAKLRSQDLSAVQSKRALEIITIANNIEEAADRISVTLVALAKKMAKDNISFSDQGMADLEQFHDQIMANGQLAFGVLITGDTESARLILAQKDRIRAEELRLQERHFMRLQKGSRQSKATTNMHQETLRLLKQINAAISYVAYPIAQETGDLLDSRLAPIKPRSSSKSMG